MDNQDDDSIIRVVSANQNSNVKSRQCYSVYRINCFTKLLFIVGTITLLLTPEIRGVEKPPCPDKQGLFNGECITYCNIDDFLNRYTNETFEEAISKCIYSCPDGLSLYYG